MRKERKQAITEIGASVHAIAKKVPARDAAVAVILVVVLLVLGNVSTALTRMFSVNPILVTLLLALILNIIGTISTYVLRIWEKVRVMRVTRRGKHKANLQNHRHKRML